MDRNEKIEALRKARARIDAPEKWSQGRYWREDGSCCAANAIIDAAPHFAASLWFELKADLATPFSTLERFNDNARTTHADVLALFDRTIARLESEA